MEYHLKLPIDKEKINKMNIGDVICSRFRGRRHKNPCNTVLYCESCSHDLYFM